MKGTGRPPFWCGGFNTPFYLILCFSLSGGGIVTFRGTKISKNRFGNIGVVIIGVIVQFIAFVLIFLTIPNEAAFGDTDQMSYINSR